MIRIKTRKNEILKLILNPKRFIYSVDKKWPNKYDFTVAKEIESHWKPILSENHKTYTENKNNENLPKKYILSMFPYPSGRLHMGHVRVYTLSDVLARFYRSMGFYVIHPIGWDAFGLPAENAAIDRNVKPYEWTQKNVEYMSKQLKDMSFSFDWNRELFTCEPSYYKWTQYLFLKFLEKGLAYQDEAIVNWDPVDKTVLAFEQIDENGKSWRSGAKVEQKYLKQWFIKSRNFIQSLGEALNELNSEDWNIIKKIQRIWIGSYDGCDIMFHIPDLNSEICVFTREPFGIYGISHICISQDNILIKKHYKSLENNQKLPCFAINPITSEKIPIFLKSDADYGIKDANDKFLMTSKLCIPSLNSEHKAFANLHQLKYNEILSQDEKLINSKELNGFTREEAFKKICEKLRSISAGGYLSNEKLKDWVVSRQRYWGTPCPIIYCDKCKIVPVPYKDLPVQLPIVDKLSTKGLSQLKHTDWYKTKCPKCNGDATRETDTLDTFVDSSWYFLRYLDPKNENDPFDKNIAAKNMPVDIYIGGAEHAITHLFVSRLVTHFLYNEGLLKEKEPFKRFIAIGMVKGESYRTESGKYIEPNMIEIKNDKYLHKETGEELTRDMEKMSKSKLNGIDPEEVISKYGLDFTRLYILSYVHPRTDRDFTFQKDMVDGTVNLMQSIWKLVGSIIQSVNTKISNNNDKELKKLDEELYKARNSIISMMTYNLSGNFNIPSYIVFAAKLAKVLKKIPIDLLTQEQYLKLLIELLIMISPTIPHFANECWFALKDSIKIVNFDTSKLIHEQSWPKLDENYKLSLYFKFGNKIACKLQITPNEMENLTLDKAHELFKQQEKYKDLIKEPVEAYKMKLRVQYPYKAAFSMSKIIQNKVDDDDIDANDDD